MDRQTDPFHREDQQAAYAEAVALNGSTISADEQERLRVARVLVAGLGAECTAATICLARLGLQRFRLADPDDFAVGNLANNLGASTESLGRRKVEGLAKELTRINPRVEIEAVFNGVTTDNAARLVEDVDCVIMSTGLLGSDADALCGVAREAGLAVVSGHSAGLSSHVYAFDPRQTAMEEARATLAGKTPLLSECSGLAPASVLAGTWIATAAMTLLTKDKGLMSLPRFGSFDLTRLAAGPAEG